MSNLQLFAKKKCSWVECCPARMAAVSPQAENAFCAGAGQRRPEAGISRSEKAFYDEDCSVQPE